jgi:ornithine cyclodeaminase/alanine dehydrogenase-like protein (mu-crystallin family)
MLILNRREVGSLLSMPTCIDLMEQALASLSRGEVILPLRPVIRIPDTSNAFAVMPTYSGSLKASAAKLISVYPDNHGTALDSHQGMVALFDGTNGKPLAIMDAFSITSIRTAAVSGVATKLLARRDARTVAILGAGTQGRSHIDAMLAAHPFERVLVWSRNKAHAAALVTEAEGRYGPGPVSRARPAEFVVVEDIDAAVREADVVCTVTAAREPLLRGGWLRPGTHVNAVGSSVPTARELDTEAVRRSRVFVDRRESAVNEAGDLIIPMNEGAVGHDHVVAELGELILGTVQGRENDQQITLFKSLGLAVEDLACAVYLHERATREGVGATVDL